MFDWEASLGRYDYQRDDKRQSSGAYPASLSGGAGTLSNGSGTGWRNLALKGTWRPDQARSAHVVDFGYQLDAYRLKYKTTNLGNYLSDKSDVDDCVQESFLNLWRQEAKGIFATPRADDFNDEH